MTKEEAYKELKACYDLAREGHSRTGSLYSEGKMDAFDYALQIIKKID